MDQTPRSQQELMDKTQALREKIKKMWEAKTVNNDQAQAYLPEL